MRRIWAELEECDNLLRPANFPKGTPGRGVGIYTIGGNREAAVLAGLRTETISASVYVAMMSLYFARVLKEQQRFERDRQEYFANTLGNAWSGFQRESA